MYGWQACRPAVFMSKKFTNAQQNSAVHELETLAILEALLKWQDKLLGYKIYVIMDHKGLEFFKTQQTLTVYQQCWMDYKSKFNFDIIDAKRELNKVADCLSHYYESDMSKNVHYVYDYVHTDTWMDPEGDDLSP